ncbi:hypothetical protein JT196_01320 [Helicobacter pylori]|nr:hypothetical protein [Helicobacter pylori]MCQ2944118.1 hypothetical protein [Helicobacter pylori]
MLGLVVSGALLFGWDSDDAIANKLKEQLSLHEYVNNMGVKQYRLGSGDLEEIFKLVDIANDEMFNYANPKNSKDMINALITNMNSNILLKNKVLQDEADTYLTEKKWACYR